MVNQLMQQEHNVPSDQIGEHQKTFTAAYDDPNADERRFAQAVVEQTGAAWYLTFPTAETLQADLEAFIWHHDEPPISTSLYAQWAVMRLVREHGVTVVLDGQGSDELLAGYLPFDVYLLHVLTAGNWSRFWRELREIARVNSRPIWEVVARMLAYRMPAEIQRNLQRMRHARMLGLRPRLLRARSSAIKVYSTRTAAISRFIWQTLSNITCSDCCALRIATRWRSQLKHAHLFSTFVWRNM